MMSLTFALFTQVGDSGFIAFFSQARSLHRLVFAKYFQEEANRVKLKKKLEMAQVLTETLAQMPKKKAKGKGSSSIEDFTQFMEKVSQAEVDGNKGPVVQN